jgi:hypothetical protein
VVVLLPQASFFSSSAVIGPLPLCIRRPPAGILLCGSGGSSAFYVYAYGVYYYHQRSEMTGFMQYSFYFGYMITICYAVFIMLGTAGILSCLPLL